MDSDKANELLRIATNAVEFQRERINAVMGREAVPALDSSKVKFWSGSRVEAMVFVVLERGGQSDWSLSDFDHVRHTSKDGVTTVFAKDGARDDARSKAFEGL